MDFLRELWESDDERMSVGHLSSAEEDNDVDDKDIVIHEYEGAEKLIVINSEEKLIQGSFKALKPLMNMYQPIYNDPEVNDQNKQDTILKFINSVIDSGPGKLLFDYLVAEKVIQKDRADYQKHLWEVWFEPVTTYYGFLIMKATAPSTHTNGFEHVFCGEVTAKFKEKENKIIEADLHGYHNWVKFYWDQTLDSVDYVKPNYSSGEEHGLQIENIVTCTMDWKLNDEVPSRIINANKRRGGFLIGSSPALELAMGTAALSVVMKRDPVPENPTFYGNRRNNTVNSTIEGNDYGFILYPNTERDGSEGYRVRSFFPTLTPE